MKSLKFKKLSRLLSLVLVFVMLVSTTLSASAMEARARYSRLAQPSVTYSVAANELGVVNFQPVWGDKDANVRSMMKYIQNAHAKGVKLLLFPEMCVTGYASSSDPNSEIYKWAISSAETKDGPTAKIISSYAKTYKMWIVYGATEVIPDDVVIPNDDGKDHAYNSVFACSPTGEVITYQKMTPVEGSWCTPGDTPVLIDATSAENLKLGLIGLSICYDTYAAPEIGRYYAAKGANFLLNPTATSRSYSDVTNSEGKAYAPGDVKDGVLDSQGWEWYYRNRLESNADREGFKILSANLVGGDGPKKADGSYTYNFPGGSAIIGSNATYYAGIKDTAMLGTQYANLYPSRKPELITATPGLLTNSKAFTAATGSTCRDIDFAPELYASWYKELADKMKAGNSLKYSYSYAEGTTDNSAGYKNFPKASVANMIGIWGNKEATIKQMDKYVEEAAASGVDMLLFPETVLTGYGYVDPASDSFPDSDVTMQVETAETIPGATTNHFKALAEKYNMIIVIGMCEKENKPIYEAVESGTYKGLLVEKIYNSAAIIFPDKETISYRKTQRAGSSSSTGEGQWSVTGDTPVMFETKWGKVGIDICRDGHFYPEEGRYYAASGCNIFFHITATTGGPWYRETRIGSYTDRDGMAAITANLLGLDGMVTTRDPIYGDSNNPTKITGYSAWYYNPELEFDPYDIAGYLGTPSSQRTIQYSYGQFNSTSLIITPYHDANGRKSFDPITGYGISLNGTGPESEGFAERKTSPVGLETAVMDLSGTGFNVTNFNPDLYSRMYDELAVLYREGYVSLYPDDPDTPINPIKTNALTAADIPLSTTFMNSGIVTLSAPEKTTINYTLNGGAAQTVAPGQKVQIPITQKTQLTATATKEGCEPSDAVTRQYGVRMAIAASNVTPTTTFTKSGTVTVKAPVGTTMYYTTSGQNPTTSSAKVTNGGSTKLAISKTTTVKYMLAKTNCENSAVVSCKYTVKTADPTVRASKKFKKSIKVKLKAPSGTTLFYTTNGTKPKTNSSKVAAGKSKTITLKKTANVKVMAIKTGCTPSNVVAKKFTKIK